MTRHALALAVILVVLNPPAARAGGAYPFSDEKSVIGLSKTHRVAEGESLHEIARMYDLGYNEIIDANPGVSSWVPEEGTVVSIPSEWVLPDAPKKGIVINLAEMRLYHYMETEGRRLVRTYPIGVGIEGFETPIGSFSITEKVVDPYWHVPASIKKERPELPAVVPPGMENPLGTHALRLSERIYLIHGTNNPYGVGRRVSHGCIRLYPEDIVELFGAVGEGAPVSIVYQPLKAGIKGGVAYIEAHEDYAHNPGELDLRHALDLLRRKGAAKPDKRLIMEALKGKTGVPFAVSPRQ